MGRSASALSPLVLVVEDEALLRLHAVDMLEEAGFTILEAKNADEAVRILADRQDIRVIFTDIDMPGSMDGMKLAAVVRDRWPPVEIIMTSGFRTPAQGELPARGVFLPKPYDNAKVIGAIRAFLN